MNLIESTVDGVPFIAIHGELDRGSSQPALDLLDRTFASSPQPENLLVDLTNCTFLDSGGLDVLMYGATLLPASGWLGIVGASENTTRILEIVGFTGRGDRPRLLSEIDRRRRCG